MSIAEKIAEITNSIPTGVKLVAVSKTKPSEMILEAYESGYKIFGENKPQELKDKFEKLPKDIEWHMIGHLQTNKVKYIAPFVSLIHGVESIKLLTTIDKEANKNNRVIDILMQIHIAQEETKFGLDKEELISLLESEDFKNCNNIRIVGLMGMATYTADENIIKNEFRNLKNIFNEIQQKYFSQTDCFKDISMGMSGDYKIAINEGSTIIRVGSSIFGNRNYNH